MPPLNSTLIRTNVRLIKSYYVASVSRTQVTPCQS